METGDGFNPCTIFLGVDDLTFFQNDLAQSLVMFGLAVEYLARLRKDDNVVRTPLGDIDKRASYTYQQRFLLF